MPMQFVWLIVMIMAIIVEVSAPGLISIWFVPSSLIAMLLAILKVPLYLQITVFLGISCILIAFSQTIWKSFLAPKKAEPTNADSLIGKVGIITNKINNLESVGEVKVNGQYWSARSVDDDVIAEGSKVEIISIEGVKLIVKKFN